MTTQKDMLSGIPVDKRVLDGNACNIPGKRCECCLVGKEWPWLLRPKVDNRQIGKCQNQNPCKSIKTYKADWNPDPESDLVRGMQIGRSKEAGHGDNVLNDEELVIPATHRRERSEENKSQNNPCRKTMFGVVIGLDHSHDVVEFAIVSEPKGHVNRSRQPQRPGNPTMVPI